MQTRLNSVLRVRLASCLLLLLGGMLSACEEDDGTSPGAMATIDESNGDLFSSVKTLSLDSLVSPSGLAMADGRLFVSDFEQDAIFELKADGSLSMLAGGSGSGVQDGRGTDALFDGPAGIAIAPDGGLIVADALNHRIRRVAQDGTVTTIAGSGPLGLGAGGYVDGPADLARFNLPSGVAFDSQGNLLIADKDNHAIRLLSPHGVVSTLAGGQEGYVDGEIAQSLFSFPVGLAVAADGTIYVTEHGNNAVRRIRGIVVTTLARRAPFTAPDPPGSGSLAFPSGVLAYGPDVVLIADVQNNRIVTITPDGRIESVAGSTSAGSRDGSPRDATFRSPTALLVLPSGNVLVADSGNGSIRELRK